MIGASADTGLRALKPGEGIEAVRGFCQGLNALDEFADVASQLMMKKYWVVLSLVLLMVNIQAHAKALNAGPWKFLLRMAHAEVPFIIEFNYNWNFYCACF